MKEVYINKITKFLPNRPVSNDEMEEYLGQVNDTPSKSKSIVLRRNGITTRYYAMEKGGKATHTSASINAAAAELLFDENFTKDMVEILGCGTSMPDQFLPSLAFKAGRICKNRSTDGTSYKELSEILIECSYQEDKIFGELHKQIKKI